MSVEPPAILIGGWASACDQAARLELQAYCRRWSIAIQTLAWLERRLGQLPRGLWLEAGCGTGILLDVLEARLAPEPVAYFGCDTSAAAVELARLRHPGRAGRFSHADAAAVPTVDGLHDVWIGLDFLAWATPAERAASLAEARRLLRPGGLVVVSLPLVILNGQVLAGLPPAALTSAVEGEGFTVHALQNLPEPPVLATTVDFSRRRSEWPKWVETALAGTGAADKPVSRRLLCLAGADGDTSDTTQP